MKNKTNSFVAEWNSHWSDVLYNEFRAGVTQSGMNARWLIKAERKD